MRSSVIVASLCAALSVASPIHKAVHKKDYVYDITTEIIYVTVTEGYPLSTPSSKPSISLTTVNVQHTVVVGYTPSEAAVPVTASSSSILPPPPSTTSISSSSIPVPAPEPTTSSTTPAPEPTITSTVEAPVVPATTSEAVVQAIAATTSASAAPAASPTDYEGIAIWHHNMHRANHTAGDLVWDSTLATYALATANTCVFAHDMTEGGGGYGQNLAAYGSTDLSSVTTGQAVADGITNQWYYGEAANMPYGVASPSISGPEFLHFSAMLWKASTKVGCATVTCAAGTVFSGVESLYTVCDYESEGNVMGEFNVQVTEPIGNPPITAII